MSHIIKAKFPAFEEPKYARGYGFGLPGGFGDIHEAHAADEKACQKGAEFYRKLYRQSTFEVVLDERAGLPEGEQ